MVGAEFYLCFIEGLATEQPRRCNLVKEIAQGESRDFGSIVFVDPPLPRDRYITSNGTPQRIWPIRESYLSLLTDIVGGSEGIDSLRQRRDDLQTALASIYKGHPIPTARLTATHKSL